MIELQTRFDRPDLNEYEFDRNDPETVFAKNAKVQKNRTSVYRLHDQAYWDAIVLWDHLKQRAIAVRSQVISLREATKYTKIALKNALPF